MTPHQTVALSIRLFVIWLIAYIVITLPSVHALLLSENVSTLWLMASVGFVLLCMVMLWNFPITIAKKLLPTDVAANSTNTINFESWFEVGITLIGLWVLSNALPSIFRFILVYFLNQKVNYEASLSAEWKAAAVYYVIQIFIGIWFLLQAKGVSILISKIRGR
jgi:hypothetical protein